MLISSGLELIFPFRRTLRNTYLCVKGALIKPSNPRRRESVRLIKVLCFVAQQRSIEYNEVSSRVDDQIFL